jgi:mannitol 2-dehydrogenase
MTPEAYVELIARRFGNPAIVDTVRRVAFDGAARHAAFVLPIVREALAKGGSVEGLALVEAPGRGCASESARTAASSSRTIRPGVTSGG